MRFIDSFRRLSAFSKYTTATSSSSPSTRMLIISSSSLSPFSTLSSFRLSRFPLSLSSSSELISLSTLNGATLSLPWCWSRSNYTLPSVTSSHRRAPAASSALLHNMYSSASKKCSLDVPPVTLLVGPAAPIINYFTPPPLFLLSTQRRALFTVSRVALAVPGGSPNMRSGTQRTVPRYAPRMLRNQKRSSYPLLTMVMFFILLYCWYQLMFGRLTDQMKSSENRATPLQQAIAEGKFANVEKSGWS